MISIKHQLLALSALALLSPARAQVKEGRVVYERKVNMHRNLADQSMKSMVPEFNTSKTELRFSAGESLYKNIKEEEDIRDKAGEGEHGGVFIKFGGGDDQVYKNYDTEKMTEQRELGPKKYIIEDSLPRLSWKLEEGSKTIKNYTCKKATAKNRTGKDVIAWYAEDLQSSSGPEAYGGLPGLILELDINNAEIAFTALEISTGAVKGDGDKMVVKAPTDGKKISRKEFKKMMDDQFGPDSGGGVKTSIRIIRN
jgi:GLPGLI family protein